MLTTGSSGPDTGWSTANHQTCHEVQDQVSRPHEDASEGCGPVGEPGSDGWRRRYTPSTPGAPAIVNHLTRHEVHHQVSRRRVASDARTRAPEH